MKDFEVITDEKIVLSIVEFIKGKRESEELKVAFPNPLLREDVLDLLDRYCTVVYYPLENESNNGFHTNVPNRDGGASQFVFINTAQTMEKQVFTAAHELGHIWKVDDYIVNACKLENEINNDFREHIINRFAAELLMPKRQFATFFLSAYSELEPENDQLTISNTLKLIAKIMNFFFVPMKAVVLRFFELKIIDIETCAILLGQRDISEDTIQNELEQTIKECGYTKLLSGSRRKWIEGLAEMLDVVEQNNIFPSTKTDELRKIFDLPRKGCENELISTVKIIASKEEI